MKGYFAIGVEGISKTMNVGALLRTAHAFDASFVFTIAAGYAREVGGRADTSDTEASVPLYTFASTDSFILPRGCKLVGVEIVDEAVELPSFCHPRCAAYVLGPERGCLSSALLARCDYTVRIPTRFAINVALAGALVMYDRLLHLGRFAERPLIPGGPPTPLAQARFGAPRFRRRSSRT